MKHLISLGEGPQLDLSVLLSTRLLVQGSSGSGKTYLLRRLLEDTADQVCQIIIDPEGEFTYLSGLAGHTVIDAERYFAYLPALAAQAREKGISVVLDLSGLEPALQVAAVGSFLPAVFDVEREFWTPALVVIDESHLFAGTDMAGDKSARQASSSAMANLMSRGRKRGLAGVIATQRVSKIAKNVVAEALNFLVGRTFLDIDLRRTTNLLGLPLAEAARFRELSQGDFVAFGPALALTPLTLSVGPVSRKPAPRPGDPLAPLVLTGHAPPADEQPPTETETRPPDLLPGPLRPLLTWLRDASPATVAPGLYLAASRAVPGVLNAAHAKGLVASLATRGLVTITEGVWATTLTADPPLLPETEQAS